MRVEVGAGLMMRDVLLAERRDHVAVIMERAVIVAMSSAVRWTHLGERIITVEMLAVAPRAVDKEQAFIDNAATENGILSFVHVWGVFVDSRVHALISLEAC